MKPMVFSLRVVLLFGSVGMFAFILYLIKNICRSEQHFLSPFKKL